ncbi:MAG: hypothetical protein QG579_53 [Patescibacteria group bacterium]|jgi:hypothetical protein|nr:hypothetical protein [Patescibacteria group bacterium]
MKIKEKRTAISLRKRGMTISEIQKVVHVSKSSISLWIRDVQLSPMESERIENKITAGQLRSREVIKQKSVNKLAEINKFARESFKRVEVTKSLEILLCACLYEGEGNKGFNQSLSFTNSDPKMISTFLGLLRSGFDVDESKFRVCIHLHHYHDKNKQLEFWSNITRIPKSQFMKPFMKKNSGLYKKEGYAGCISIRYYDISLKRKLMSIFKELVSHYF